MVIWITGLSGSGKTTIAKKIYNLIKKSYNNCCLLDGDIIREALNYSWGYTLPERLKGAKQVQGLSRMLDNEGMIVVCATMSLFKEIHENNRLYFDSYLEIFLDVDMEVLIKRDKKLLYSRAIKGLERNVVGINLSYEEPQNPHLYLTNNLNIDLDNNIKVITKMLKDKYKLNI